jgi:hypothetical protein
MARYPTIMFRPGLDITPRCRSAVLRHDWSGLASRPDGRSHSSRRSTPMGTSAVLRRDWAGWHRGQLTAPTAGAGVPQWAQAPSSGAIGRGRHSRPGDHSHSRCRSAPMGTSADLRRDCRGIQSGKKKRASGVALGKRARERHRRPRPRREVVLQTRPAFGYTGPVWRLSYMTCLQCCCILSNNGARCGPCCSCEGLRRLYPGSWQRVLRGNSRNTQ